ncbi:AbrB/MazE/SpoVT family DNA-binding domain-containing protein [Sporichthya brevicatena]
MSDLLGKATLRAKGQITLSARIREALHAREGDDVEFREEDGVVYVRAVRTIAADQAWFWSPEWQAGEVEASQEIARGETEKFDSTDEFLKSLGQ